LCSHGHAQWSVGRNWLPVCRPHECVLWCAQCAQMQATCTALPWVLPLSNMAHCMRDVPFVIGEVDLDEEVEEGSTGHRGLACDMRVVSTISSCQWAGLVRLVQAGLVSSCHSSFFMTKTFFTIGGMQVIMTKQDKRFAAQRKRLANLEATTMDQVVTVTVTVLTWWEILTKH